MINMERTAARISGLRKARGMTQAELAARLMVSPQAVSKWETGQSLPDSGQLLAISELFGVTINSILTGEVQVGEPVQAPAPTTPPRSDAPSDSSFNPSSDSSSPGDEERTDESASESSTLRTIIGLAPFIDSDTLGQLLEDCDWSGATVGHLESVAAFLSSDVVDRLLDRVPHPSASEVFKLAPFLGASKLSSLVEGMEEEITLEQLRRVAAFLVPEVCSRLFERLLNEPGDHSFEALASFAPFITTEALEALIRAFPPPNLEALRRVAPFLDEEEVGRLLRGLLKRDTDRR
jgi:transcriptional regulator with XRE-family HTH domain